MNIEKIEIEKVKMNPNNPRMIKNDKFRKLVKSIKEFPEMLEVRPIVVDDDMVVLGGNMRLKACKEAGLKEVYIIKFSDLSEEKKKEFIVKDNVGYGEWDFDLLLDEWDKEQLIEWGLDIKDMYSEEENYSRKIEIPIYEIKEQSCPSLDSLYNRDKYDIIVNDIKNSNIDEDLKNFLILAASRHIVFDFETIAEYYSWMDKDIKNLFEEQALVIIDFNKAIEKSFVDLTNNISKIYLEDYEK